MSRLAVSPRLNRRHDQRTKAGAPDQGNHRIQDLASRYFQFHGDLHIDGLRVIFPGQFALYPCIGAALIIWPRAHGTVSGQILGWLAPIRLISYSLYLWHWPVWVYFRIYINSGQPTLDEAAALAVVSIILATLSYRYVEQPFRRQRWSAPRTVSAGLAGVITIFCLSMYVDSAVGLPQRLPPQAQSMRSLEVMWEWPCKSSGSM